MAKSAEDVWEVLFRPPCFATYALYHCLKDVLDAKPVDGKIRVCKYYKSCLEEMMERVSKRA